MITGYTHVFAFVLMVLSFIDLDRCAWLRFLWTTQHQRALTNLQRFETIRRFIGSCNLDECYTCRESCNLKGSIDHDRKWPRQRRKICWTYLPALAELSKFLCGEYGLLVRRFWNPLPLTAVFSLWRTLRKEALLRLTYWSDTTCLNARPRTNLKKNDPKHDAQCRAWDETCIMCVIWCSDDRNPETTFG